MPGARTARAVTVLTGGLASSLLALVSAGAQTLPATAPTTVPQAAPTYAQAPPPGPARHRAEVTFANGQLAVRASNSSLNGILREIARQTGMTISGGVLDQRVFGQYGPAPAEQVISGLLDGTGTNMILRMADGNRPGELILSARMGGPTPPSPTSQQDDPTETSVAAQPTAAQSQPAQAQPADAQAKPESQVPPLPFSKPAQEPAATDTFRTPVTPDPGGIVSVPTVNPHTEPGTTPGPATQTTGMSDPGTPSVPASPNGVKTPQQIYEELQKLLQQQNKQ